MSANDTESILERLEKLELRVKALEPQACKYCTVLVTDGSDVCKECARALNASLSAYCASKK